MFSIGLLRVCRPLIRAVELLDEPFGQQSLEVAHEDDVILAVEVNPAVVTVMRAPPQSLGRSRCGLAFADKSRARRRERYIDVVADSDGQHQ